MLDALFPRTRQRVLSLIFGQETRAFGTRELIKLAQAGSGAVQREIDRLVSSGLVTVTMSGNQKRFSANQTSPMFEELRGILEKTTGVASTLQISLAPLSPSVKFAVLFGSVAKETDHATSDLDVLIVTDDLTLERVFEALDPAEKRLGRRVSPTLYTSIEFLRRRKARHPFLTKVLAGKHIVLLGSEDGVTA
jgi:predicted nucleotidyltransferase